MCQRKCANALDLNDDDEEFDFGMNINGNNIDNEENNADLAAGRIKQRLMIRNYFS